MSAEIIDGRCTWCGPVGQPMDHLTYCPFWGPYCDECEEIDPEWQECVLCGRYHGPQ